MIIIIFKYLQILYSTVCEGVTGQCLPDNISGSLVGRKGDWLWFISLSQLGKNDNTIE